MSQRMRIRRNTTIAVTLLGLASVSGCGGDQGPDAKHEVTTSATPIVGVNELSRYPDEDPLSWAAVGDHLVVATVTGIRNLEPDDQLQLQAVTYTIDEVLWTRDEASPKAPGTMTVTEYGWVRTGDDNSTWSPMRVAGVAPPEEGATYLMVLVWADEMSLNPDEAQMWTTLGAEAVIPLAEDGTLDLSFALPHNWVKQQGRKTPAEVVEVVAAAQPEARKLLVDITGMRSPVDADRRGKAWSEYWQARAKER